MDIPALYSLFLQHPTATTDTRHCPKGSIFFALKGEHFNGNQFAHAALEKGCAYAVVDEVATHDAEHPQFIVVEDVLTALQQLAAYHRQQFDLPVIQITGTNGKTTTKELCAAVLQRKYQTLFTAGNLNNHIGTPLTLLRLTTSDEIAIIETGANHIGEIGELAAIVQPNFGLITNIGKAHLEGFGSFEGVRCTKGELYDFLRTTPDGSIFLHEDDPLLREMAIGLPTFTYGSRASAADVKGEVCGKSAFLHVRWEGKDGALYEAQTHLIGNYNLPNALAAIAMGQRFGINDAEIVRALEEYMPSNSRSELRRTANNELIIDAYNANPTSMAAALTNFAHIAHENKLAIIGEMRELGATSEEEHKRVVQLLQDIHCSAYLVGNNFAPYAHLFPWFENVEVLKAHLTVSPLTNKLILIKGSNGTRLFELPDLL